MENNLNDDLYIRIVEGDKEAFSQIHEEYKGRLFYFANKIVFNWNEAEDIVADAFLALWLNRQQLQSNLHLKNFLFLAVRNKAIDIKAKQNRRQEILTRIEFEDTVIENINDLKMIEEKMLFQLREAVATLPQQCGRIFKLSWHAEKSSAEIGLILGINQATVRSQKRRAIHLIQKWIRENKYSLMLLLSITFC